MKTDVVIIGAGLSGLTCARVLQNAGISYVMLEKSDAVGGRIRTDLVDGFRLDRGFQVLLTAYPMLREYVDMEALRLKTFYSGAWIHVGKSFQKIGDPRKHREDFWLTLWAQVGRLGDKFRILKLRKTLLNQSVEDIFSGADTSSLDALRLGWKFSESMIEMFFRPFLGGIMLDHSLRGSSRMMDFVLKMFIEGDAALPEEGMQAIPEQLAAKLPPDRIRLHTAVQEIRGQQVVLADGSVIEANLIVLATDPETASGFMLMQKPVKMRSVYNVYFAADQDPIRKPVLALEAEPKGPVNHIAVLNQVAPSYAPTGKSLISVTVLDHRKENEAELMPAIRKQLRIWFGDVVDQWQHLRTYHLPQALPEQRTSLPFTQQGYRMANEHIFLCGDYLTMGSIEGAMRSGEAVGKAVVQRWEAQNLPKSMI